MTIQSSASRVTYAGDNVTTLFPVPYLFFANTDVSVVKTAAGGAVTPLTLNVDYTLAGAGVTSGGTLTKNTALLTGETLGIFLDPPRTQLSHYLTNDIFPAATLETNLDREVQISQRLYDMVSRAIRAPDSDNNPQLTLPSAASRALKYLTFDASGNISPAVTLPSGTLSRASIGAFINPQTTAEGLASVTPTDLSYLEGDIRRYGALTSATSNHLALNAALAVSSNGGRPCYVPGGDWKVTAAFTAIGASSMYGDGYNSRILVQGAVDGLTFAAQPDLTTRFFWNFSLIGSAGAVNGIICNLTAASAQTVSAVLFEGLYINGFAQGVFMRGLWESLFLNCRLYNNYQGYYFHGQSVVNHIIGGFIQKGPLAGAGTQYGVLTDVVSGETCQSLHLTDTAVYAYDILVSWNTVLFGTITNCDLSVPAQIGIQLATCRGGIFIQNNWIQPNSASFSTVGVQVAAVGTPIDDRVVIQANQIVCQLANAGSIGVDIQAGNTGVVVNENTIGSLFAATMFSTGVKIANGAHNAIVKHNTIAASASAVVCGVANDVDIGPNVVPNGTPLALTGTTPPGFSYYARGSFTLTLTGMTAVVTGTINWVASGKSVVVSIASAGISGTSNAVTMTGTGWPAFLLPVTDQSMIFNTIDNGVGSFGLGTLAVGTAIMTFKKDANASAFTAAGVKGLNALNSTYSYA